MDVPAARPYSAVRLPKPLVTSVGAKLALFILLAAICICCTGTTYSGNCGFMDEGGGHYICECISPLGHYEPKDGESDCNHSG